MKQGILIKKAAKIDVGQDRMTWKNTCGHS